MTVEKQLKAIFNIPENVQATPVSMAIEYESMMQRLEIKQKHLKSLYDRYLAEQAAEESEHSGRTVTSVTCIEELGFSEKCTKALQKKNITKLSDLSGVSRTALLNDKAVGSENVARLERIIAPLGIMFKYVEDYQDVRENVIDDASIESSDNNLRAALALSDREVEERVQKRVAEEMEDFKANYETSKCDDCTYRREAEEGASVPADSAEKFIQTIENAFSDIAAEEDASENAETECVNETMENTESLIEESLPTDEFKDNSLPGNDVSGSNGETAGTYLDFLDRERIEVMTPFNAAAADNDLLAAFDGDTAVNETAPEADASDADINQFLAELEDEPEDDICGIDGNDTSELPGSTSEDAIFSQIADLIDIEGFEPTIENETVQACGRSSDDIDLTGLDLHEQGPDFTAMKNHNKTTFVPNSLDSEIYTGLEEDVDVSMDDIFDDED